MTTIVTIECEECGGKSVVKIPKGFDEDYQVVACPLCGGSWEGHRDLEDEGND